MTTADRTIHAIDSVLDAHEAAYHPGIACPETQEGRCALARPVESPEARMRDARTAATDRSFAAYLTAQERDQLDARAATAEAERDDARDDRDAYKEARDVLRRQLDETRRTITAQTAQLRANRTLLDRLRELGELTDRAWAEHDTNADREYAALSFTDAVCDTCHLLKIDHTNGPCQPGLGSPPPRAQDQPDAWIVPKIAHDQNRLVGPRVHGRWIHRAAGQSDPEHARRYAAELLAAADEAEKAEG